jgi:hypothetical protein
MGLPDILHHYNPYIGYFNDFIYLFPSHKLMSGFSQE